MITWKSVIRKQSFWKCWFAKKKSSRAITPEENCPPNLKTNPNPNPNPNRGAIFFGGNCLFVLNPKTNPNLDPNHNPNRATIFLGGQLSAYQNKARYLLTKSKMFAYFNFYTK